MYILFRQKLSKVPGYNVESKIFVLPSKDPPVTLESNEQKSCEHLLVLEIADLSVSVMTKTSVVIENKKYKFNPSSRQ